MGIFSNINLINNLSLIVGIVISSFVISFVATPMIAKLAKKVGAIDLPASMRRKGERGLNTRLHTSPVPKLGGLAMSIAIFIMVALLAAGGNFAEMDRRVLFGIIVGSLLITILGYIDDVYEVSAGIQFLFQFAAAAAIIIIGGVSVNSISLGSLTISLDWFTALLEFGRFSFPFVFPGSVITILWIVGLINVINWVGGVDALNGTVSSLASLTLLILVLLSGNIPIAILMAVHLGSILGVLPFNYNPAKIYYGSIGDYLNGYLLAVFSLVGSTRWGATVLILALPILDGLYVVFTRLKNNPEARKSPLKLLSLSGHNHLHHRLLKAGFSKKVVVLIEAAIMVVIGATILIINNDQVDLARRNEFVILILGITLVFIFFTVITALVKRAEKKRQIELASTLFDDDDDGRSEEDVVVKMIIKDGEEEDKEQKFVY